MVLRIRQIDVWDPLRVQHGSRASSDQTCGGEWLHIVCDAEKQVNETSAVSMLSGDAMNIQ
jgi:hypothetical protein